MMFFNQPIERAPADAKHAGGMDLVALSFMQNRLDVTALDFAKMTRIACRVRRNGQGCRHVFRQVVHGDDVILGQDLRAFENIGQLTHVARP